MILIKNKPIGMLDSGVGGLAVAREVISALPYERLIYVGDTLHFPYGTKKATEVLSRVRVILDFFVQQGVKLAVLACNTASAVSLPEVRGQYPFPIMGVIEAGARMAAASSRNGCIGVLATERTVQSGAYALAVRRMRRDARVIGQAAPGLVTMVEAGFMDANPPALERGIIEHVEPLVRQGIDTLILGCTHFLTLHEWVARLFPGIAVIDPAAETAREAAQVLAEKGLAVPEPAGAGNGTLKYRFLITGDDFQHFRETGSRVLGREIVTVEQLKPYKPVRVL